MSTAVTQRQPVGAIERWVVRVLGIVQGVGFRPFIHRLSRRHQVAGTVLNYAGGVDIEIEGPPATLQAFVDDLRNGKPPIAVIEDLTTEATEPTGEPGFEILPSRDGAEGPILVSPEVAVCADCERELLDPADRHHRHPFVNCTNCGPRFTIIRGMPYDRPMTSMAPFPMCDDCRREYEDIDDRRFHAQPVACPSCGPTLSFQGPDGELKGEDALAATVRALRDGNVVAVKGLGGFHLACDATNDAAVRTLRERKNREEKPLAIMAPDVETIASFCDVPDYALDMLTGIRKPICLLPKLPESDIAPSVAPDSACLGVMLPYTPLHRLLLSDGGFRALVMTSGNLSDEPLARGNQEAFERLSHIADAFCTHDREILVGCDDSVARPTSAGMILMRRARGFAPFPVRLPEPMPSVLALGAHLKNVFCLTKGEYAYPSQHIGDLDDAETLRFLEHSVQHYLTTFRAEPESLACDLHPDYWSTRHAEKLAEGLGVELTRVQHHHAHIVSCMADRHVTEPVVGIACDGTGLGDDGTVWGCEVMVADYTDYTRKAHLRYIPLPGGDRAVREPWRVAATYLSLAYGPDFADELDIPFCEGLDRSAWRLLQGMIDKGVNSPPASSAGRLFDAVAALVGVRQACSYEGQAAIRLEALAEPTDRSYPFEIDDSGELLVLDPLPMFPHIISDIRSGASQGEISGAFHNMFVDMLAAAALRVAGDADLDRVALSGGTFQNEWVLTGLCRRLREMKLDAIVHENLPCNDGGLSLGQAVVAGARLAL